MGGGSSPTGVVKALCPPKVALRLQSTGNPRMLGELSGGRKERVAVQGRVRSRDRAASGREEKPPRLRAGTFGEGPPRAAIKLHSEGKGVSAEIFFSFFLSFFLELYIILEKDQREGRR